MSVTDEIKSRVDLVDLVAEAGVNLRHAGKNYTGFCPFHENKKTPAFVVWPDSGTWRCFGQCNEGGDIFKFVMKRENIDFKEALNKLAERAGVQIPAYIKETPEQREAYENLRKLLEDALIFYRRHLLANPTLLNYLHKQRGLTDASIETFGLGYAPHAWDSALNYFTKRGYSADDLLEAGLVSERDNGGYYDRFRNRVMIPIRDEDGKMSGFGARIIDPNDIPKFLNSPETPIFSKGRLLYGLDRARKPIRTADQAVIVEGYLDVIALHQAGYENVVSPMGTALTEDQLRLLKRFTRKIVLALDPDTAGQKAVLRGLDAARSAMDREGELGFDARGLLHNEARLQADLRVASMPDDLDPDEIVARDKAEWARLIESAKPIVTHVMETLAAGQNINDPKVKNQVASQVIPLIEDLPSALERDTYRQQLARMLRVDERALLSMQPQIPRLKRQRRVPSGQTQVAEKSAVAVSVSSSKKAEAYIIGVLFEKPELVYRLDRTLQEFGLTPLNAQDFEYTDHQMLFGLIRESVEQDKTEHHEFVMDSMPVSLQGLSRELVAQAEKLERAEEKLLEELLRGVIKLRRVTAGENLNQLRFLQEEAHQGGDLRAASYQGLVLQHTRLLRDLDQAFRKMSLKRMD
ncbi:MAG TPA: DNA primase [Anaerolineales bacterium]|jgi:DNA primase|nr:DNA primase [Anaerolineales bacterium]